MSTNHSYEVITLKVDTFQPPHHFADNGFDMDEGLGITMVTGVPPATTFLAADVKISAIFT